MGKLCVRSINEESLAVEVVPNWDPTWAAKAEGGVLSSTLHTLLKFRYSEKATKIRPSSTCDFDLLGNM